jgi:hypothetical protein
VSSRATSRLIPLGQAPLAPELVVVVACHGLVCTLPVRHVERLHRRDEVEPLRPAGRRKGPGDGRQLVTVAGEAYAAWNLGTMLELPPLSVAWVLLQIPGRRGPVPVALRTGACLVVQEAPPTVALPPGVVRARGAGIAGAFTTEDLRGKGWTGAVGLSIDPERFWSEAELEASWAAVEAAGQEEAPPA